MGRILLVVRLALRDLRRRRTEAALLLVAILAATTTLTLGLVVRDAASDPYQSTRAATHGPDVVATTGPFASRADLEKLATASGVCASSKPTSSTVDPTNTDPSGHGTRYPSGPHMTRRTAPGSG